jgi:DNA-binding NarL/FixJ family response regulator
MLNNAGNPFKTIYVTKKVHTKPPNGLTSREFEVFILAAEGNVGKDIAKELNISFKTVKNHIYNIHKKLNITCRAELISHAYKNKILVV